MVTGTLPHWLRGCLPQTPRERRAPSEQTQAPAAKSPTGSKAKDDVDDSPAKRCGSVDLDKVRGAVSERVCPMG